MFYSPKHAAPKSAPVRRRLAGVAVTSVAAVGGATAMAQSASAGGTVWDRVAACESGGNWAINTGNGYYGGLQFSYSTWKGFGGQRYATTANKASKGQQIEIAQKVLKTQGPGAWPVCSKRAGLTRENGAAVATPAAEVPVSRDTVRPGLLAVDGRKGPATRRAIESWIGGSVNGSLSKADTRLLEKKVGGTVNGGFNRSDVRKLQKLVGATADGSWGPKTTAALQRHLNAR
ncbi:putative secreted protein [Janibacter sp. HTCC2649]|uniref:transglycosylase family protein n=1 Tax=Janibacter sp. HTCC2649 TaxID=313589 RepID=UPI00006711F9|nr:transglycosylase family protein [Janibacter sp. HTCC2649]EAP97102.1 putative secreted protein [Janibacter sp. HTCC2649]